MTNSWRALARMARDRIVQADPEDLSLVLNACIMPSYYSVLHNHQPLSLSLNSSGPSVCPPSPVSASSTKPQPKRPTSPTRSAASRLPQRAPTSSSTSSPSSSTSYTPASSTGRAIHRDTQTRLGRSSADADVARGSPVLTPTARCGSSARRA
jgi:hypothetical protein